ncbi:50S ribosomal protein L29 [uncultured Ruminococcus sp.]|uniref:50S ribosomal protein L29 n=1 Tax=uncultured Ruminococcus sp. TaxID=165186 RepID=UPI00292FE7EF|nr:50S ribosomal protein L29 [uncultured Ruminococcus sp.]
MADKDNSAKALRELPKNELELKLKNLKQELFNLRFQLAINQLDNPMRITKVKRDIARVSTVMRELADQEA